MDDLISRQAAIEALYDWEMTYDWDDHCRKEDPKPAYIVSPSDVIEELSSAQPERKKGKWEEIEVIPEAYDITGVKTWASKMQCNQCGFTTFAIEGKFAQYDYCPNCGADMRGKQNDSISD